MSRTVEKRLPVKVLMQNKYTILLETAQPYLVRVVSLRIYADDRVT
jgi:hypothetical protein